jgi:lysophospholipase L1-like esterase
MRLMEARRKRRLAATIVVLAFAVAAMLGELVVRLTAPQILSLPWPAVSGVRVAEPGATGRVAVRGQFDTRVRFSSQRFRADREFSLSPPRGVTRIAVLGDSFVFGWGVEARESFPAQLESVMRSRGRDVEVINAGIPGHSMGEKAIWYRDAVARFRPSVVIVELLLDDIDDENGVHAFALRDGVALPVVGRVTEAAGLRSRWYSLPLYEWLSQHSHAFALMKRVAGSVLLSHRVIGVAPTERTATPERLQLLTAEVLWLPSEDERNGGRLIVVAFPLRETIYGGREARTYAASHRIISEAVRAVCVPNSIPFTDLTTHVKNAARRSPVQLYYSGNETHPNVRGYAAFAQGCVTILESAIK